MADLDLNLELETEYDFNSPVEFLTEDSIFRAICQTSAFKRLKKISFLGGIDYYLRKSPNGFDRSKRYMRYDHSLGVGRLASHYASLMGFSPRKRRLIISAALLHDIGHAPLSHSIEDIFEEFYGLNHHITTERIILGKAIFGNEIGSALRAHGVEPDEVVALLSGNESSALQFFSGPINFDTIEAITRARRYFAGRSSFPTPLRILHAAVSKEDNLDRTIVDGFWLAKSEVYRLIVRAKFGVIIDDICKTVAKKNWKSLDRDDFYQTDDYLLNKIPDMKKALQSFSFARDCANFKRTSYVERNFYINESADFFHGSFTDRYLQSKRKTAIEED